MLFVATFLLSWNVLHVMGFGLDMLKDFADGDTSKLMDAAKEFGSFGYETNDDGKAGSGLMALLEAMDMTKFLSMSISEQNDYLVKTVNDHFENFEKNKEDPNFDGTAWKMQTVGEMKEFSKMSFGMVKESYMKAIYNKKFNDWDEICAKLGEKKPMEGNLGKDEYSKDGYSKEGYEKLGGSHQEGDEYGKGSEMGDHEESEMLGGSHGDGPKREHHGDHHREGNMTEHKSMFANNTMPDTKGWGKKKIMDEVKKEIANRHRDFKQKQNQTDFDPRVWKNQTIGWLRKIKKHVGEDLTETDIEDVYSEHFDDWKSFPAMSANKTMHEAKSTHFKPEKLPPMKGWMKKKIHDHLRAEFKKQLMQFKENKKQSNFNHTEWKKHAAHWMINSTKEVRDEVPTSELHQLYKEEMEAINEVLEPWERSIFESNDAKLDDDQDHGKEDDGNDGDGKDDSDDTNDNSDFALTLALATYSLFCL